MSNQPAYTIALQDPVQTDDDIIASTYNVGPQDAMNALMAHTNNTTVNGQAATPHFTDSIFDTYISNESVAYANVFGSQYALSTRIVQLVSTLRMIIGGPSDVRNLTAMLTSITSSVNLIAIASSVTNGNTAYGDTSVATDLPTASRLFKRDSSGAGFLSTAKLTQIAYYPAGTTAGGGTPLLTGAGKLDLTQAANTLPTGSLPAFSGGDVSSSAGSNNLTVTKVGGVAAATIAAAATNSAGATSPADNKATANALFLRDNSGNGFVNGIGVAQLYGVTAANAAAGTLAGANTLLTGAALLDATKLGGFVPNANGGLGVDISTTGGKSTARTTLGVPATDGTGATGSAWPIGVTGNAATATSATSATTAAAVTGLTANQIAVGRGGSAATVLPAGSSGQFLKSSGASVDPAWSAFNPQTDIADETLPSAKLLDLALTTSPANLTVGVLTGNVARTDGGLTPMADNPTTTVDLTSIVTGAGATRYVGIYLNNAGTLQTGTATLTPDLAVVPTGSVAYMAGWAYLPANCTGLYPNKQAFVAAGSPSLKGYILRPMASGFGGSGGVSGAPAGAPFVIIGSNAGQGLSTSATNIFDMAAGVASSTPVNGVVPSSFAVSPNIIRNLSDGTNGANSASLADFISNSLPLSLMGALQIGSSNNTVQLIASTGSPILLGVGGRDRKNTSSVQSPTTSGSTGLRYVKVDCSASNTNFAVTLDTSSATTQYQAVICSLIWDNTNSTLQMQSVDWSYLLGAVPSSVFSPQRLRIFVADGGAVGTLSPSWQYLTGLNPGITMYFAYSATADIVISAYVQQAATTTQALQLSLFLDGAAYGTVANSNTSVPVNQYTYITTTVSVTVAPGAHVFSLVANNTSASLTQHVYNASATGVFTR